MKHQRRPRNTKGPGVNLSFTAPVPDVDEFDSAAATVGLTRAAYFYRAVKKETRRVLALEQKRKMAPTPEKLARAS